MASQNYGTAFDTEYNARIHEIINALNVARDTNGEPDHLVSEHLLEGGSYLSADGKIVHPSHYMMGNHPHLHHPILGSMSGDGLYSGGFGFGKMLKHAAKDVGKHALDTGVKVGTKMAKDKMTDYMTGGYRGQLRHLRKEFKDAGHGQFWMPQKALDLFPHLIPPHRGDDGMRPEGWVGSGDIDASGFVDPLTGQHVPRYIQPGGRASYPFYNMVERQRIDARGGSGAGFGSMLKKAAKGAAKDVGKHAAKTAVKVGTKMAKDKVSSMMTGEGTAKGNKRVGRPKGSRLAYDDLKGAGTKKGNKRVGAPAGARLAYDAVPHSGIVAGDIELAKRGRGRPRKDATGAGIGSVLKKAAKSKVVKGLAKKGTELALKKGKDMAKEMIKKKMEGGAQGSKKDLVRSAIDDIEDLGYILKSKSKIIKDAEGGNFWKKLGHTFKNVGKAVAVPAVGALTAASGNPEFAPLAMAATSGAMKGSGKSDGRKRRAEIVKKIMKEKGLKMTDASAYVKKHGLYTK